MKTIITNASRATIRREYGENVTIVKVYGGWAVFGSRQEWRTWKAQK